MRWSELENFTYGELSTLRHCDIESDKYELLLKARKSMVELSPSAKEKLEAMCADLMPPEAPMHSFKTIGDCANFVCNAITICDHVPKFISSVKDIIELMSNLI